MDQASYTTWWNEQVLECCRRSWNMPNLTLEEMRGRQIAAAKRRFLQSEVQFDRDRDLDERGITARDAYNDEHPRQSGGERV